jgi:hypothetical protein
MRIEVEDSRESVAGNCLLVDRAFQPRQRRSRGPRTTALRSQNLPVASDKLSGERSRQLYKREEPYPALLASR